MTDRQKHRVAILSAYSTSGENNHAVVSLPALPWETEADDRRDTAPGARTIRYAGPLDPLKADPVLRHADARRDRG